VVVETGTAAGEVTGGGLVAGELAGGLVAGELAGGAGLLRGAGGEFRCEVDVPLPLIDHKLTSATSAATKPTAMMRMDRLSQRLRRAEAVDPSRRETAGASAAACVGGAAD
jgi:hypothetical protein